MTLTMREGVPFCGFLIFLWLVSRVKKKIRDWQATRTTSQMLKPFQKETSALKVNNPLKLSTSHCTEHSMFFRNFFVIRWRKQTIFLWAIQYNSLRKVQHSLKNKHYIFESFITLMNHFFICTRTNMTLDITRNNNNCIRYNDLYCIS